MQWIIVNSSAIGKCPIHLIKHQITFLLAFTSFCIFFQYQITNSFQTFFFERGACWILWCTNTNKCSATDIFFDVFYSRHEIILYRTLHHTMHRIGQVCIVIVIPGRNTIDHFIAFVNDGFEQSIDQWTTTGCYLNFIGFKTQSFPFFDECCYRLTQIQHTFCCRIACVFIAIRVDDEFFQLCRNGKYRGIKITDGEVIDLLTIANTFTDGITQFHDLTA